MRGAIIYLAVAAVLGFVGTVLLAASRLDSALAVAQQGLWVRDYETADAAFETAEQFLGFASLVPGIGDDPLEELQARRASASYWQRQYSDLVEGDLRPSVSDAYGDNTDRQLVVAHAVYRLGQQQAEGQETALAALDAGIQAYQTVLRQDPSSEDAAYNYEFLVRLRAEIQAGDSDLPQLADDPASFGSEGGPQQEMEGDAEFKVYIPLDAEELDKVGGAAGKSGPREKKG
ncbi:MAG: hypothetical protein VYE73_11805 [Acidobacteriota bacterium]|nr:hypothetical protein [Acidobacteriota bacterium]